MMCVFHQSSSSFFSEFLNGFLDLPINQSCPLSHSNLVTLNYICAYAYPVKLASFTKYKKCFKLLINNQAMNLPLITRKEKTLQEKKFGSANSADNMRKRNLLSSWIEFFVEIKTSPFTFNQFRNVWFKLLLHLKKNCKQILMEGKMTACFKKRWGF